jgi:hypothetical protein
MQIIIDEKLAFNVGTTMRNGLCMMICDTPGGELFTYLHWETKQKAIEIEAYSHHPVTVSVKTGKEVKAPWRRYSRGGYRMDRKRGGI